MNLDIEAEHGHDRGTEALFVTETRINCRDFEDRSVIRRYCSILHQFLPAAPTCKSLPLLRGIPAAFTEFDG
jgi:hypothetical protein